MNVREALRAALQRGAAADERVFLSARRSGSSRAPTRSPPASSRSSGAKRIREAPIYEEGFVGLAVGAAMTGLRPVVEIMTLNFILVAMDQVVNHAAKVRYMFGGEIGCPLVIRTPNGAGNQLTAQHSQSFEGWFAHVPGLKVVAPATPADAKGLLKAAIRDDDPVIVIENLPLYKEKGEVPDDADFTVPIGEARVAREGADLTIVAHSYSTVRALQVAERLEEEDDRRGGDRPALAAAARHGDGGEVGGEDQPGALRRGGLADVRRDAPSSPRASPRRASTTSTRRCRGSGMAEVPMPYAKNLENATLPHERKLFAAVLELLGEDPGTEWREG